MSKTKVKIEGVNVEVDDEILKEFPTALSEIEEAISDAVNSANNNLRFNNDKL